MFKNVPLRYVYVGNTSGKFPHLNFDQRNFHISIWTNSSLFPLFSTFWTGRVGEESTHQRNYLTTKFSHSNSSNLKSKINFQISQFGPTLHSSRFSQLFEREELESDWWNFHDEFSLFLRKFYDANVTFCSFLEGSKNSSQSPCFLRRTWNYTSNNGAPPNLLLVFRGVQNFTPKSVLPSQNLKLDTK